MRSESGRAMALVEVLVIVVLIVLVVSLLMPGLGGGGPVPRTVCLANLRAIAQGCVTYAAGNNSRFPCWLATDNQITDSGAGFGCIGKGWNWDGIKGHPNDPGMDVRSNTRNLWLLVRMQAADTKTFVCPLDPDAGEPFTPAVLQSPGPKGFCISDMQNRSQFSYSFQYQGPGLSADGQTRPVSNTTVRDDPKLVILADRSPMLQAKDPAATDSRMGCELTLARSDNFGKAVIQSLRDRLPAVRYDPQAAQMVCTQPLSQAMRSLNSPNHKAEGQNFIRLDGSGDFAEHPWVGAYADNIWTVQDPGEYAKEPDAQDDTRLQEARMRGLFDVSETQMLKAWQQSDQSRTRFPDSFLVP